MSESKSAFPVPTQTSSTTPNKSLQDSQLSMTPVIAPSASWDNTDGFGSGNGVVGDYSSQLNLPGTTTDGDPLGREYIERNDILSDYGCYEFRVTVTMTEEWASELDSTIAVEEFTFERGMNSDEDNSEGSETIILGCN